MATATLALIILAAILAQIAIAWLIVHYRKRRQTPAPGASTNTVRPAAAAPAQKFSAIDTTAPTSAWEGFREFIVQRRKMEDGNADICSFYLAPADGNPLPAFKPGQFLTFKLQVQDPASRETKTVVRCYTISDRPRPETYRVTIKRLRAPLDRPELPPGVSSNYFHDQVQEGSRLLVKAPSGHFHLMEDEPLPIVLIGGGIGITPMLSILNTILDTGVQRQVWLYYGVCNGQEQIMKPQLQTGGVATVYGAQRLCTDLDNLGHEPASNTGL
ncbi:MAG: FAD-binding oxidoreductase, partial [Pseudomonadota bacterium]|nr:FAD-binding oxidoreductase [Pseudomonadota bacterium]